MRNGVFRSFQFSGRASRSEFWWFAPIAILPVIAGLAAIPWGSVEYFGIWRLLGVMALSVPLLSAGARRLQDTGEFGSTILWPFMPMILLWLGYQAIYWFVMGTFVVGLDPLGLVLAILLLMAIVPLYIGALIISLFSLGPIIGQLLLPSEPGPNRFGPNPREVIPWPTKARTTSSTLAPHGLRRQDPPGKPPPDARRG